MYKSYLEITDMPTDTLQALGKLRTVLVATFNKAREHKHRMALLKAVIKFMHTKIVEFEKEEVKREEALEAKRKVDEALALEVEALALDTKQRKEILDEAAKLEIDLDERLTTDKLAIELADAITALEVKTEDAKDTDIEESK
jgi:hypothetical protein